MISLYKSLLLYYPVLSNKCSKPKKFPIFSASSRRRPSFKDQLTQPRPPGVRRPEQMDALGKKKCDSTKNK